MDPQEDEEKLPMLRDTDTPVKVSKPWYFYKLVFFSSLGGFLFGYDTGVISGAMIPLKRIFQLTRFTQQIIVSVAIAAAIVGSWISGFLNSKLGRRFVLITASVLFTVGSLLLGFASGVAALVIGRIVVGLGIGLASATVPVYIAESAPASTRGNLVTLYQLMITIGILCSSVVNGLFSSWRDTGWKYMLGAPAIPSLVMFLGCLFIPKSPRFLIQIGQKDNARKVLQEIRGTFNVDDEFNDIVTAVSAESDATNSIYKVFNSKPTLRALLLGCGLQVFQQLSGINTVMYYSASIIQLAGIHDERLIIWFSAVVSLGNTLFTLPTFCFVDKVGRRKLTLGSMFGVFTALCLLAVTFRLIDSRTLPVTYIPRGNSTGSCQDFPDCRTCVDSLSCGFCSVENGPSVSKGSCLALNDTVADKQSFFCSSEFYGSEAVVWSESICPSGYSWLAVISMIFYVAMFAPGLGPMPWTINAEIYPLWARHIGMSAASSTNWMFNLIVSLTFLSLMNFLTRTGAFSLYACLTFIGLIFTYFLLPETKGKTLEEMEQLFRIQK